jgi:hypothetical protein
VVSASAYDPLPGGGDISPCESIVTPKTVFALHELIALVKLPSSKSSINRSGGVDVKVAVAVNVGVAVKDGVFVSVQVIVPVSVIEGVAVAVRVCVGVPGPDGLLLLVQE